MDNSEKSLVKAKRGRKPKTETLATLNTSSENDLHSINNKSNKESSKEFEIDDLASSIINMEINELMNENTSETSLTTTVENADNKIDNQKTSLKKRGRKPKGGKIVQHITPIFNQKNIKPNIILHLKCSLRDLVNSKSMNNIESYDFTNKGDLSYNIIVNDMKNNFASCVSEDIGYNNFDSESNSNITMDNETKEIWKKIKQLEQNLHINNISDKKSACFWCTHAFDNPPIYIPKHYIKNAYEVYGCFCSPECAVSHLMEENIDSSAKFERYHFINYIYGKIYNYNKNIKPAPNPYYMLDKYYGNLTIQEYRSLFKKERLFLIVDKPLTRVLPELHEDNDDFILNNKIIPHNNYKVKKTNSKSNQKSSIMNEKFGIHPSS